MNYKTQYELLKKDKDSKVKKSPFKISTDSLHRESKFIAAVPVENFFGSMQGQTITARDGETMSGNNLLYLCRITSEFAPGYYIDFHGGQRSTPNLSGPVPYIMYCHKLHNGTKYEEWRSNKHVSFALGHYNKGIEAYGNTATKVPEYSLDELVSLRNTAMNYGGKIQPATSWALRSCGTLLKNESKDYHLEFDTLTHQIKRMLLQSWLLNAETRTKHMILDPNDWDNMPEALDERLQQVVKETTPW